ncbi:MAG: DEAD/DEAH box helicase, partial [Fenollaria timonensis]
DLRKYIELADEFDLKYIPAKEKLDDTLDKLKVDEDNKSDLLLLMNTAIETKYYDSYRDSFENLKKTYEKIKILKKRNELLDELAAVAPTWKEFIYNRFDIHGLKDAPENIEENWYYKQFDGIISKINRTPYEKYQKMMTWYKKQLYDITKELASNMAWHSFMLKIKDDIEKKQALQGWQLTMKKIGKGTGKQAIGLKKEAKELMKKCQRAVPAWIMTIDKALESLDYNQKFDYLIIDEASQADISAIPILQLAKKAIIVGDDEQVSPQAVGIDQDKQRNLIDMYIKDKVANSHLYDLNSSLYDILKTSFPVLTLKEHFRSVPMIAAYSNFISYDGIIKPLRESSSTKVQPALKLVKLGGIRNEDRVNEAEANYIADEIIRIKDEPDYEGKTIGVISLASEDQAKFIDKLLIEKLSLQDYDRLNILCGRPAAFQGDERDIIFLTTVDSNDKDEAMKVLNEGAYDVNKKKYN